MFSPGDPIFHPKHGFGTITGLTRRVPLRSVQAVAAGEDAADQALEDHYSIQLMGEGTLLVPVDRAERAGLRLLSNGVDAVIACLRSPAQSLSGDSRKRASELWTRGQMNAPTAPAEAVRDMLAQSHGRARTATEKTWLEKACDRLSIEAALVDGIPRAQAYAAIWNTVKELSAI